MASDFANSNSPFSSPITARLHWDNTARNCFGHLLMINRTVAAGDNGCASITMGSGGGFFRVLRPADAEGDNVAPTSIVLQIHLANHRKQLPNCANLSASPILFINGHFAAANGLQNEDKLILQPLTESTIHRCESVEILPLSNNDWEQIAASAAQFEEQFLHQIRLVQPGMRFCLHLLNSGKMASFAIGDIHPPVATATSQNEGENDLNKKQPIILLDVGTRVLVAAPSSACQPTISKHKGTEGCNELVSTEGDSRDYLSAVPEVASPRDPFQLLRVLPDRYVVLPNVLTSTTSSHPNNPFFAGHHKLCRLLNTVPFIFSWNWSRNDLTTSSSSVRNCFVEIEDHLGAMLIECTISGNNGGMLEENGTTPFGHFCGTLFNALLSSHQPSDIPHCWLSPALRRELPHCVDLSWLRVRPLCPNHLELAQQITIYPSSPDLLQTVKTNFLDLISSSVELGTAWIFPRAGTEWTMQIGSQTDEPLHVRMVARDENSEMANDDDDDGCRSKRTHRFIWPLSPQLLIHFREDSNGSRESLTDSKEDDEKEAKTDHQIQKSELEWTKVEGFSCQLDLVSALGHSVCSFLRRFLLMRFECQQTNIMPKVILLGGPIGSGKSTLLALLAHWLEGTAHFMPVATKLVDCVGSSLSQIESAISDLATRWPSALLLDNFDTFAEGYSGESEQNGSLKERVFPPHQQAELFAVLFSDPQQRKVPIVCAIGENAKLADELFEWEGQPLIGPERHRIRTLERGEQLEVLDKLLGKKTLKSGNVPESLPAEFNFGTIGELHRLTERFKQRMSVAEDTESSSVADHHSSALFEAISATSSIGRRNEFGEGELSVRFVDIAGLEEVKKRLVEVFIWPNKYPDLFALSGLNIGGHRAILHGPSGCGKSMLIRALSSEMGVNVISVRGPQLLSKYIGQSEQNVRQLFAKAKSSQPALIVFEEFDALAPQRGSDNAHVTDRVVNQLLTELDGFQEDTKGIFVIAATNRLDLIDKALLRSGRFDHKLFIGLPDKSARLDILRFYCSSNWGVHLSDNVNLSLIAGQTEGWCGSELYAIVQNAIAEAERESKENEEQQQQLIRICQRHLQSAVGISGRGGKQKGIAFMDNNNGRKAVWQQRQRLTLD